MQRNDPPAATRYVAVEGVCPMGCGDTLFLGDGGHVTCSWCDCPNPAAADELLGVAVDAWPTARDVIDRG